MKYNWQKTGNGIQDNLGFQLEKEIRLWNNNHYQTRDRYKGTLERFISEITDRYKLQKLENIDNKHLEYYAEKLKDRNCSPKYIKTELSGIRFFHRSMNNTKNRLMDAEKQNKNILDGYDQKQVDQTKIDRSWTDREVSDFRSVAVDMGRNDVANVLEVSRALATRLNETVTLKSFQIQKALDQGYIHVTNTKSGIPRDIALTARAREIFQSLDLEKKYPLVRGSDFSHDAIKAWKKSVQDYVKNNREKVQDQDRKANAAENEKANITMHGLRHARLKEYYLEKINQGFSEQVSKLMTSELAGHHRERVTEIYITNL